MQTLLANMTDNGSLALPMTRHDLYTQESAMVQETTPTREIVAANGHALNIPTA